MDYRKEEFPLNHFALWTKGWYHKVHNDSTDENTKLFEELKSVLELDDYSTKYMDIHDICRIVLNAFEDYNLWRMKENMNYMRLSQFIGNIRRYKEWGYNEDESIIMVVRSFIQGIINSEICLRAPHYSKELYKKYDLVQGCLMGKYKPGTTYKQMNKDVEKYNWIK